MPPFIHVDFLLLSDAARRLYHEYAEPEPILDYHCHLPPREIAEDRRFENMTQIWLGGDHYKWRAMRWCGVSESFITGDASDWEKFEKWAEVFPQTLRHPLFHWTMLELARPFGIFDRFLNPATARSIWNDGNALLARPEFSARGLMKRMNVRLVCTTDDPADDLRYHRQLAEENASGAFDVRVLPTFRPDKAILWSCETPERLADYNRYLDRLGEAAQKTIRSLDDLLETFAARHEFFHSLGGRLADHGFDRFAYEDWRAAGSRPENIFAELRAGQVVSPVETRRLASFLLEFLARRHAQKNWAMQIHLGAIRNNSSRIFDSLGPDAGCDSIADEPYVRSLGAFFDRLDRDDALPKTIVYNLNPSSNEALAAMIANFSRDVPGKMQYGSGWWFLDQRDGMKKQLETLSTMGLLSQFVGMLTDSRSFLSYTRHEYFRRILCDLLGGEMESGVLPNDFDWVGGMVKNICCAAAVKYFQF